MSKKTQHEPVMRSAYEKEIRRIVRKVLHIHGLSFQDNLHGKLIRDEIGLTKMLKEGKSSC
jgi:hypothetical protein